MTEKDKEHLAEGGAFAIILLFLAWIFWTMFGRGGSAGNGGLNIGGTTVGGTAGPGDFTGGSFTYSPYAPSSAGGGGCCCDGSSGCPIDPNTIQSVNQMSAAAASAYNQIIAAGNNTLIALADYANANDPLLNVTVG